MSNTKGILKTLRLPNLLMLMVVQFIVSHFIVEVYSFPFYLLITLSTISIALGGYLLNDIQDLEIDKFNLKLGWINDFNKREATVVAIAFHILGLILGFYASSLSSLYLFPWFVCASMALVAYAFFFSKYKIIGNFLISGLVSLTILLSYYLVATHKEINPELVFTKTIFVSVYAALGFLLNWIREVCKDIEDLEGDKTFNRYSIPIMFGVSVSKFFIGFVLIGFMVIIGFLILKQDPFSFSQAYLIFYIFLLLLGLMLTYLSKGVTNFKRLSFSLKILMLIGLLLPAILNLS